MARTSARRVMLSVATAASSREPRSLANPPKITSPVTVQLVAKKSTKAARKRGRPANVTTVDRDTNGKFKKHQNGESKAGKRIAKRGSLVGKDNASGGQNQRPSGAPKPKGVYNDELGTTELEYEVEAVRNSMMKRGKRFYFVKWVGWPESANSWEPEVNLRNSTDLVANFDEANPAKP